MSNKHRHTERDEPEPDTEAPTLNELQCLDCSPSQIQAALVKLIVLHNKLVEAIANKETANTTKAADVRYD